MTRNEYLNLKQGREPHHLIYLINEHAKDLGKEINQAYLQAAFSSHLIYALRDNTLRYFDNKFVVVKILDENYELIREL